MQITEKLLHFVWKYKCFDFQNLTTVSGDSILLQNVGYLNPNAGPDFSEATIEINEIKWVGTIEIHTKSSLWEVHQHHLDAAYNNVILHVVYEHDKEVFNHNGQLLPTLELKNFITPSLLENYEQLLLSKDWLPCHALIHSINVLDKDLWLESVYFERLELKVKRMEEKLEILKNDWEELFYQFFIKYFGDPTNALTYERFSSTIPFKTLIKNGDNPLVVSALLFGQAGFLEDVYSDNFYKQLQTEFHYLQSKYLLTPLKKHEWYFLRMRPAAFPTLRLAQLSALIVDKVISISSFLSCTNIEEVYSLFKVNVHPYWEKHYHFEHSSEKHSTKIGKSTIHILAINVIVPMLFLYGRRNGLTHVESNAIKLLQSIPSESNRLIKDWKAKGINSENALQSQSLIHLRKQYCEEFKCLECRWGQKFLTVAQKPLG